MTPASSLTGAFRGFAGTIRHFHSSLQGFLMSFTSFGLSERIMDAVRAVGYTTPTPIQSLAILPALAGKDLIASAQTGTGKTAAFVLPMLHRLTEGDATRGHQRDPRALVLTPTRELAQQVQQAVSDYGRFLSLRALSVYGGVSIDAQFKQLRRGADIVVATPGRLLDHMQRGSIDLSHVEVLVLDEADRMLDMGFIRDIRKIVGAIPKKRQTLLFSATISSDIASMAANILNDPQTVEAGERHNPAATIEQHFYAVPKERKMDLLVHAIQTESMESVLVFSRTKHGADKITKRLDQRGVVAVAIHSDRTQGQRERALESFRRGRVRVLVATDIAARGIDVTGISHVINFDVPLYAEDYIHRIGRTGRAGATGSAITFVGSDEQQYLRRIEQFIGRRFTLQQYPGMPAVTAFSAVPAEKPRRSEQMHIQPKSHTRENYHKRPRSKKAPIMTARKKKPIGKMESFSSSVGEQRWSNH
jgi:ATP-dependent RNA helicase RhlE